MEQSTQRKQSTIIAILLLWASSKCGLVKSQVWSRLKNLLSSCAKETIVAQELLQFQKKLADNFIWLWLNVLPTTAPIRVIHGDASKYVVKVYVERNSCHREMASTTIGRNELIPMVTIELIFSAQDDGSFGIIITMSNFRFLIRPLEPTKRIGGTNDYILWYVLWQGFLKHIIQKCSRQKMTAIQFFNHVTIRQLK